MGMLPFELIVRERLVRADVTTDPRKGCYPDKRPIDELLCYGIVNIDKPPGPTSHQVSDFVQRIIGVKKAGHSGTLDPGVTGVLPIAFANATRIVQTLLVAGKEYVALMHLHKKQDDKDIQKAFLRFTGEIEQLPPIKSAVKRVKRKRTVYYIEMIESDGTDVLFRVGCQAGTYIRKLIHDMGRHLGCGAHMAELRRTKAGPFSEATLCTLQDLADAVHYLKEDKNERMIRAIIQPVENAASHLGHVYVMDSTIESLCHGANLNAPGIASVEGQIEPGDNIAVMSLKGELVCLGKADMDSKQMIKKKRGLAVKTEKVFMQPGTYELKEKN